MKLTKTLMAAAAMLAFAAPMSASAQVVPGDLVGELTGLAGDIVILRDGNYLQAQNGSALMANDTVFARNGNATIALTGCNGKFVPCTGNLGSGMKVNIGVGDVCNNLGGLVRIGARDAVLNAGQRTVSGGTGGIVGASSGLPLAAIGAVLGGGILLASLTGGEDDAPTPISN